MKRGLEDAFSVETDLAYIRFRSPTVGNGARRKSRENGRISALPLAARVRSMIGGHVGLHRSVLEVFRGRECAREGSEDWSEGERRNRGKEGICGGVSDGREIKRRKLAMGVA